MIDRHGVLEPGGNRAALNGQTHQSKQQARHTGSELAIPTSPCGAAAPFLAARAQSCGAPASTSPTSAAGRSRGQGEQVGSWDLGPQATAGSVAGRRVGTEGRSVWPGRPVRAEPGGFAEDGSGRQRERRAAPSCDAPACTEKKRAAAGGAAGVGGGGFAGGAAGQEPRGRPVSCARVAQRRWSHSGHAAGLGPSVKKAGR